MTPGPRLVYWAAGVVFLVVAILMAGVGIAALLARQGNADEWSRWSDVGETFGALSSIISGLALVALVVTFKAQYQELREHRRELGEQRQSLIKNHGELRRTAESNLRSLHLEILRMSIDDPDLAEVWPPFEPNLTIKRNRQYLYANAIYNYHWTALRVSDYSDEQIIDHLRYLFTSPLMRDYWRAAAFARTSLVPGSAEHAFAQKVDEVCREYEAVVASAAVPDAMRSRAPTRCSSAQLHRPEPLGDTWPDPDTPEQAA